MSAWSRLQVYIRKREWEIYIDYHSSEPYSFENLTPDYFEYEVENWENIPEEVQAYLMKEINKEAIPSH